MPLDTAMMAAADSTATRSHQLDTAYPPPSCSAFHGRSGSSECTVITCGTPYSSEARCPPRLVYQVWECTRSADPAAAAMDRSADTTNPRSLSCSLSTPMTAFSGTMTFLSMIAFLITACRPTTVLCSSTERSTVDQLLTRTPGESTDSRTRPPDTMTPLLTMLSMARPTRSPESCTNFAGGWDGTWVRIGQRSL